MGQRKKPEIEAESDPELNIISFAVSAVVKIQEKGANIIGIFN